MKSLITIIITLVILGAIAAFAYFYAQLTISRLNFKFDFGKIDLSNVSLTNPNPEVSVITTVDNQNPFNIPFTNLFVKLYVNDRLIAQSKQIDTKKYLVPQKGSLTFNHNLQLYIDPNTILVIRKFILKENVRIDYEVNVTVFNMKLPVIKDYFTLP